ncbi:uncharacterized protein LOC117335835 isoform X2 [Pecten maximus]|uniref:uncharacterized protein LOC117335835 isoform X2 n=1 Tax=Pecten maximus TaxID=6579 RepID=UPI0014585A27|nr:uncharacterized protein LOC117335835 isoform X2 [Pecten maximus]
MDTHGPLPPPPSYEEAQGLQITVPRSSAVDNEDTPPSMPLLGVIGGNDSASDTENQHFGQLGAFPASTVAVSSNNGTASYTNVISGASASVPPVMDTLSPTSIPIPPGHVPVITCHSCGARQQIGQYSFLPKTQVVGQQARVSGMAFYSSQPSGVAGAAPTYMITAGQQPGYPPSVPASGVVPSQQQCNVAVHYNASQGTVHSTPTTGQNGTETPAVTATEESNLGCFRICCGTVIGTIVLTMIIVLSTSQ